MTLSEVSQAQRSCASRHCGHAQPGFAKGRDVEFTDRSASDSSYEIAIHEIGH